MADIGTNESRDIEHTFADVRGDARRLGEADSTVIAMIVPIDVCKTSREEERI